MAAVRFLFLFALVFHACFLKTESYDEEEEEIVPEHEDPEGYVYHEHSLLPPFSGAGMEIPYWDFGGSTMITPEYIRLTPDRQSRHGNIWNTQPWDPETDDRFPNWEVDIHFRIHGQGKNFYGDGFAFWYTKKRLGDGPVFGAEDKFEGLGIFFDTYSNAAQGHEQFVSVMLGDGKVSYDHSKDGGAARLDGCPYIFRTIDKSSAYAHIIYQDGLLRVYLNLEGGEDYEECFIIRKVHLPRGSFFGLSAATGDLADNHDIISFQVSDPVPLSPEEKKEIEDRIQQDIADGYTEKDPNYDPQYDSPHRRRHADEHMSPTLALTGIAVVGVVVFLVWFFTQRRAQGLSTSRSRQGILVS